MTITELIQLVRYQTYVSVDQMPDTEILAYLNIAYHDIENTIVTQVNEDFFYQKWATNLIDGQNEYTFQVSSATAIGFKKILQVEIKWNPDQLHYKKIPHENIQLFDSARDVLESITPEAGGFYDIKDSSIVLYPTPTEDVVNGIILSGTINLIDLNLTDTDETYIFPEHTDLRQFIPTLATGVKQYIYQARGLLNEKDNAIQEYEIAKKKMVKYLSNRDNSPMEAVLPSSIMYK